MDKIEKMIFDDIYKIIYKIKRCRSKSMLVRLNSELGELYSLCDELGIVNYPKIDLYSNKEFKIFDKREYENFVLQFDDDLNYHLEFSKNSNFLDCKKYQDENLYTVKKCIYFDEILEISYRFLQEFDPNLKKILDKKIKEKRIIINDDLLNDENNVETIARTILSCGNFSSYIVQTITSTIQDASTLCHEIGHCYIGEKNNNISYNIVRQKEINCFNEVYTYFINLCFNQFCIENNLYISDNEKVINGYNYALINYLKKLNYCLENMEQFYYDEILNIIRYSYGPTIAYHFFARYLKDRERTKVEINNFIDEEGSYSFMEILEKYNLKDEILNSKVLKKYI